MLTADQSIITHVLGTGVACVGSDFPHATVERLHLDLNICLGEKHALDRVLTIKLHHPPDAPKSPTTVEAGTVIALHFDGVGPGGVVYALAILDVQRWLAYAHPPALSSS